MIFAEEPYVLHLLAGSLTISALDAAKSLLDSGKHNVNEREPQDNLSPLHVAAAWDNLAMCQLLVHYGADIDVVDVDDRRPVDVATGRSRKFLKKFKRKRRKDRHKLAKIFSFVFGQACLEPKNLDASTFSPYKQASATRRSCPILPSAPSPKSVLFETANDSQDLSSDHKASTSSYETATSTLTDQFVTASAISLSRRKSTNFGDTDATDNKQRREDECPQRLSLFSNVTLRRHQQNRPRRSSFSCRTSDREYLSSDHTTPRNSAGNLLDAHKRRNNDILTDCFIGENSRPVNSGIYPDLHTIPITNVSFPDVTLSETEKQTLPENNDCVKKVSVMKKPNDEGVSEIAANFVALGISNNEMSVEESQIREQLSGIGIDTLRRKLRERKCDVGPINATNRRLYEGKLARIEISLLNGGDDSLLKYSPALQRVLSDEIDGGFYSHFIGEDEEEELRRYFQFSINNKEVGFFCYLLVDPAMISDSATCTLRQFVDAIFYVGKGSGARPFSHLADAKQGRKLTNPKMSKKLKRILELWDRGVGVISLQICQNIHSTEAFIREGSIIEAIGIQNLTNVRRGNFGGLPTQWTKKRITELGAAILRRAHTIFRNERCRPILEEDVAAMSPYRPFVQKKTVKN